MQYINVINLDCEISRLIMGTGWFNLNDKSAIFELLDRYFDIGGNVIDTGRFYGGGVVEGIIAEWLNSRKPDNVLLINKACHHYVDANNVHYPEKCRVRQEFITEDLHHSLKNMKRDYFDIYLLHRDDRNEPVEGLIDRLEKHRKEGKIRTYGVSNWEWDRINAAQFYAKRMGYQGISFNNPSYSLASVRVPRWVGCVYADDEYMTQHKDIIPIAWAAQASGFFASAFGDNPPDDIRKTYFTDENFKKLEKCVKLGEEKNTAPTNIALAYVLSQSLQIAVSIGPRNKNELYESLAALDLRLSAEEMQWLRVN